MCSVESIPSVTSCDVTSVTNAKRTKVSPPPFPGFHVRDLRGVNIVQHMPHSLSKLLGQQEIVRKATPGDCLGLFPDVPSQPTDRRWEVERLREWEGERVRGWESERVGGWEGERLRGWESERVIGWEGERVRESDSERLRGWEGERVREWEVERLRGWEGERVVTTFPGCRYPSWWQGWSGTHGPGSALLPLRESSRTCPSPTSSCGWGCCYQDDRWTPAGRLTVSYLTSCLSVARPSHSLTITFLLLPRGLFILMRYL